MDTALVVGGTRFIGRHLVSELLDHDYDVTIFTRGNRANPFAGDDAPEVTHVEGDRTDDEALKAAEKEVEPDAVFDCVAYQPREVRTATEIFADAAAYVYVSSGSAYVGGGVPFRENESERHDCTPEQATDDSVESYGPRKAEGDRAVAEAAGNRRSSRSRNADGVSATAERGVAAYGVRPGLVYGPHDYSGRTDYWLARVANYDRIVVPSDGGSLLHRAYVEDVAAALRIVAEEGTPGESYNVGDRETFALADVISLAADALDTDAEVIAASERDLDAVGLIPTDFPLYTPRPFLMSTNKLADLGWTSTPPEEAMDRTVAAFREDPPEEIEPGPDREIETELLDRLD